MDQRRAAAALLALAACFACSTAAPTSNNNNQTALDFYDGPVAVEGCYYNFQHYGEGDRIMTNEPCLNCTCHNKMLMCYLRVCPFTKPIGQDCTVEKRADQCCPIVTCPDVPVDLLTSTSTTSPAEYGATGLGKLDKYGCSINGKYFPEGSKVPPAPNKPCEHCYCIRNMTTCVMQECTLHVDGCTPIYHKDICCPIRYSCDHEDEIPLLDDMTTTVRPTPGFLLTTTTMAPVTQPSQECVHDDQIFPDGALIKTEKACEHCYCMKGDIVCVVQECGTPMENEGKNCVSLPPRQGQCCPDTYICEGDETPTTGFYEETTTLTPPRRVGIEGSGYRNEPDEPYTGMPLLDTEVEGSGEDQIITTSEYSHLSTKDIPESTSEYIHLYSTELDREFSTVQDSAIETKDQDKMQHILTTLAPSSIPDEAESTLRPDHKPTTLFQDDFTKKQDNENASMEIFNTDEAAKTTVLELTTKPNVPISTIDNMTPFDEGFILATKLPDTPESSDSKLDEESTTVTPSDKEETLETDLPTTSKNISPSELTTIVTTSVTEKANEMYTTTTIDIHENEIVEDLTPGRIPGEGDCLLNGLTYRNNSVVPSTNKCHTSCKCLSSIIKCDPIICALPQADMNDCYPIYDSAESCCPTYVCNTKETTAPESHSQMSGTDAPKPIIECVGDECRLNEESKPEDKPSLNECGENGCANTDQSQKDSEGCNDEKCQIEELQHSKPNNQVPCDSDKGCQVPVTMPCDGDSCQNEFEIPVRTDKPIDENQEILCKEENCRRKEHGDLDQNVVCSGSECLDQGASSPSVGLDISTEVSQLNEITTKMDNEDREVTPHTEESNSIQDVTTLKPQAIEIDEASSTGQTRAPTTIFDKSEETQGYTQEEKNTQPSAPYEVTTENIEIVTEADIINKEPLESDTDKVNTSNIEEGEVEVTPVMVTENPESTVTNTPQEIEKSSTEYSPHTVTSSPKIDTGLSESTKQITTEPNVAADTTKPVFVSEITTASHDNNIIYHEQESTTELSEKTKSPYEEEQTTIGGSLEDVTTKIPMFDITERDEIVTERVEITTLSQEKITRKEESATLKDETIFEVTEPAEITTIKNIVTELLHSTTSSDNINKYDEKETQAYEPTTMNYEKEHEITSDKEHPDTIQESTTIFPDTSTKQDEHDLDLNIPETLTTKKEETFEAQTTSTSTPDFSKESTDRHYQDEKMTEGPLDYTTSKPLQDFNEKSTESLEEHKVLSTVLPELYTLPEETKTTPATSEHTDIPIKLNEYETTHRPEIHTEYSTILSTEPEQYATPTHITVDDKLAEKEITLSDILEPQTEKINTVETTQKESTNSEVDEVTQKDTYSNRITTTEIINSADIDNSPTEINFDKEASTIRPIETTYHYDTKPSHGLTQTTTETKTTEPYSDDETTENKMDSESHEVSDVAQKSTSPASYNEPTSEITTAATTKVEDEENKVDLDKTTNVPSEPITDVITELNESTEPANKEHESENNKPGSTIPDLPEENLDSATTPKEELSVSVDNEIQTTEKHDLEDQEIITNTDRTSDDGVTDKPKTTKIHDLREKPELTTEAVQEIITENFMADITHIPDINEKETEVPMSLVTESQSSTSAPDKVENVNPVTESQSSTSAPDKVENVNPVTESQSSTSAPGKVENVNPVTETYVVASTSSHDFSTEGPLKVTVMDESQQNDKDSVTPESELTTGYNYPKPTKETTSGEVTTTNEEPLDKEASTDIPIEKDTHKETTSYDDTPIFISTSEKPQSPDEFKPEPTESNELSDKIKPDSTEANEKPMVTESEEAVVEKEATTTSSYVEEEITKLAEEITESSINTDTTEAHKIQSPETTPQYSQSSSTEAQEVSDTISLTTNQPTLHSTEITNIEIQTTPKEDLTDIKITAEETTPSSPNIIYSTDSSQKETAHEPENMTVIAETIPDSSVTEEISHEITQTESSVTRVEGLPSTETYEEMQTDRNTIYEHPKATEKPVSDVSQSEDNQVFTTESADVSENKAPEMHVVDDTSSKDQVSESHTESMIATSEQISDTKIVEPETSTEAKSEYTETTPYFVELEEHTHQILQETTMNPVGEYSTEYIMSQKTTERGDQVFTEIFIDESQTEKSTEATSAPSETHASSQLIEEQTSQEKGQTTPVVANYDTTTISALQIQNKTDVDVEPEPFHEITTESISNIIQNEERLTTISVDTEKPVFDTKLAETTKKPDDFIEEKPQKQDIPIETTVLDQERLTTKLTTHEIIYESTSIPPLKSTIADEKPTDIVSSTTKSVTSKPMLSDVQPTEELPAPDFPPSGYDQEPDYGEEDQAFGPGTCRYGGKVYVSAQQIPRDDPCDFCFCFRSDIICLQQSCPPPIHGCHEEPIQGFCCPRYECPVSMATTVNVTTTTTTTTTTLPPHFLPHAYKGAAQRKGCHIKGHSYKVGEVVRASSGPCLHCTCGGDGQMKCDPKACTPEPMLRQMIAAAVSAKRRR